MVSAIVLAAGSGKRMGGDRPKQYLPLLNRPVIYYALHEFEMSPVDEIILVVAPGEIPYCKEEIVERFGFTKITSIVEGGAERYLSVFEGLKAVQGEHVLIHDGARAFLTQEIIERAIQASYEHGAAVIGMPSKDTVKIAGEDGFVLSTPRRDLVWNVQTPQAFRTDLIYDAYERLIQDGISTATDDAMVLELMTDHPVKLVEGSYENVKITTKDDLLLGEKILESRGFDFF